MSSTLGPFSVVLLIFGGCCSNVFALEAIIRYGFLNKRSKLVLTRMQKRATKWYAPCKDLDITCLSGLSLDRSTDHLLSIRDRRISRISESVLL